MHRSTIPFYAMITFIPKTELSDLQLKTLLAYLNSSFSIAFLLEVGIASVYIHLSEEDIDKAILRTHEKLMKTKS